MNPESPLESLFSVVFGMLEGARGLQTGVGLATFSILTVLWLACRNRETGRRFGGAIAFLATAFALETVIPWVPSRWRIAVGLRAFAMLALFFGLVRALVVSADVLAFRRRAHFSTIFRDLVTLFLYGVVVLVVFRVTLNFNVTPFSQPPHWSRQSSVSPFRKHSATSSAASRFSCKNLSTRETGFVSAVTSVGFKESAGARPA